MLTLLCLVLTVIVWAGLARSLTLSQDDCTVLLSDDALAWASELERELDALEKVTRVVTTALAIMGIAITREANNDSKGKASMVRTWRWGGLSIGLPLARAMGAPLSGQSRYGFLG